MTQPNRFGWRGDTPEWCPLCLRKLKSRPGAIMHYKWHAKKGHLEQRDGKTLLVPYPHPQLEFRIPPESRTSHRENVWFVTGILDPGQRDKFFADLIADEQDV